MLSYEGRTLARFRPEIEGVVVSQNQWELIELINIFTGLAPQYIVEIGSQKGGTLHQWVKYAPAGSVIVNIDMMEGTHAENEKLLNMWQGWVDERGADVTLHTFVGSSHDPEALEFVKQHCPEINFLFIDGDHTYQGVKRDFMTFGELVNGVIALHDIMTPTSGFQDHIQVKKLWDEIRHCGYATRELFCAPIGEQDWGGIGVVYAMKPPEPTNCIKEPEKLDTFQPEPDPDRVTGELE